MLKENNKMKYYVNERLPTSKNDSKSNNEVESTNAFPISEVILSLSGFA